MSLTNIEDVVDVLSRSRKFVAALQSENERLRRALRFYACRWHFELNDPGAWDTVSGEPHTFWCDDAGTAIVEDGTIAAMTLRGEVIEWDEDSPPPIAGEKP